MEGSVASPSREGRTLLSDLAAGYSLNVCDNGLLFGTDQVKTITVFLTCTIFCYVSALCQEDTRKQSLKMSTLPATQQSAINLAIQHWNHQVKWKAQKELAKPVGDASVNIARLGPRDEDDLIVTDQSGCSPTGNCSILVLRPKKEHYRVVLEAIGQTFAATPVRANGFRNIKIRMHGSATMSTIKVYKFNGSRYLRAGCYDENFEMLDGAGNLRELKKPQITPCR
jgi:hypothetical protein